MITAEVRKETVNIRILLPSSKFDEKDVLLNINSNVSVKYFDSPLSSNEVTSILDNELMYIMGSESENTDNLNRYFYSRYIMTQTLTPSFLCNAIQ
jgi:hypothetical protein